MSTFHSDTAAKIACPCAACFAQSFRGSSGAPTTAISHFERMKCLAAQQPMTGFDSTSVAFQPFPFSYAPVGPYPSLPHSTFAHPLPFPVFHEKGPSFGSIATDMIANDRAPSSHQLHSGFWNQNSGLSHGPRRVRTVFTPSQLERLEKEFKVQQYIGSAQRIHIASQLGLSETQVKVWFQNRRIRWRKQNLEPRLSSCQ